ncbi:MAG: sugar ABC transporter permease [Firmicutes bacterium]|jgi:multiple sugar transport system permease protein|nr:sugar ABC transporter permease [Bacillota bacterium]
MNDNSFKKAIPYLIPAIIVLTVFTFYPLFNAFVQSFNRLPNPDNYELSLKTYQWLFKDTTFLTAVKNTLVYSLVTVPISIAISLMIAALLTSINRLRVFFQTVYFLPYVTSAVAVAFTWGYLFNADYGLINQIMHNVFNLPKIPWLRSPDYAMSAVMIFGIWRSLAFNVLILTTGMLSIDPQYYKAARVDGANNATTFFKITLPLLAPVVSYVFTIGLINAFKVFTEVYALIGSSARVYKANTMVFYIFDQLWVYKDYSLASAAAIILLLIILVLTAFSRWLSAKTDYMN